MTPTSRLDTVRQRPVGEVTRGTTNPNRLRRVDRWLAGPQAWRLRGGEPPIVVDLGYGRTGVTARELHDRLQAVRRDVRVIGLEIEPSRVEAARPLARPGLDFALGGFEVPLPGGASARVIRAFNVLRQYDEAQVADAWELMTSRLDPDGVLAEGTCDELGRLSSWVEVTRAGPQSLTISASLAHLERPSDVAPRLPKALIHRNVDGEAVHAYLRALDEAWARAAALAPYGQRQRFVACVEAVRAAGWPIVAGPAGSKRWRLGEVGVEWSAIAPATSA